MLKDGTADCNKPPSSPPIFGDLSKSSPEMISTGTALSSTLRFRERVPIAIISSTASLPSCARLGVLAPSETTPIKDASVFALVVFI
jgi:hypothetical protein